MPRHSWHMANAWNAPHCAAPSHHGTLEGAAATHLTPHAARIAHPAVRISRRAHRTPRRTHHPLTAPP